MLQQAPVACSSTVHRRTIEHGFGWLCLLARPIIPISGFQTEQLLCLHTLGLFRTKSLRSGILPPSLPMLKSSVARVERKRRVEGCT